MTSHLTYKQNARRLSATGNRTARYAMAFALLSLSFAAGGCTVAQGTNMTKGANCFQKYPDFTRPLPESVIPRLTNGASGRNIYDAVMAGNRDAVAQMIETDPRLLTTKVEPRPYPQGPNDGEYGDLLAFAIANCDLEMVQTLIDGGMSADGAAPGSALLIALHADEPTMAQYLFEQGASANPETKPSGVYVASEALLFGNLGGFMMLIRNGLDVRKADELGRTILHRAVNSDQYAIAEELIKAGANPWQANNYGGVAAKQIYDGMAIEREPDLSAQRRLVANLQKPDLPWPPPTPVEVRAKVVSGEWPKPMITKAGFIIPPTAITYIKEHYGEDGKPKR